MLFISRNIQIPLYEVEIAAIRATGPGGQNVNKVSSAIHLRFQIRGSSLPEWVQDRLLSLSDSRITKEGVVVIKAKEARTQEKNKEMAFARLRQLIQSVLVQQKKRIATKPTRASQRRRMDKKRQKKQVKQLRGKVKDY